ncbi:MAG: glycosyltransferase [Eubacteriales bacterium]|nr:glycosyltransferase [Eubacteriales bacterium]
MSRRIIDLIKIKNFKKGITIIKTYGFKVFFSKLFGILRYKSDYKYNAWRKANQVREAELESQRRTEFSYEPTISIIVPTYNTPERFLREMIECVQAQTYTKWELCIADGSTDTKTYPLIETYCEADARIKLKKLDKNYGISGNTNEALAMATGDYVALFDHDDLLTPDALYYVVEALNEPGETGTYDVLYTDEDRISANGKKHMDPFFKPDFSIDFLRTHNYITHFFVVKRTLLDQVGGFDATYDGAQDYDLIFRCTEAAERIKHIPRIVYHWRSHKNSTAGNPESKLYAFEAGKRALEAHLKRQGLEATVSHTDMWGVYDVRYATPGNPLISIIIPNKDHIEDLDKCVQSIYEKSSYREFEFIVVENNSEEQKTFDYYKKMEARHDNFHVVYWKGIFNYSAINNFGAEHAKGDFLLLLNNDTELIAPDSLSRMLGICMREDVGIVGAKLYYPDDTIQHAGVVLGFGGYAGHVFHGYSKDNYGYMLRAVVTNNFSAVTAACLMTKRDVFDSVGGLTEAFVVACNDVDYCLKVRKRQKLVVFCAESEWYHYESKSRGYEDTPEKKKRFDGEVARFRDLWADVVDAGDPYYNPNFSVQYEPFKLKV